MRRLELAVRVLVEPEDHPRALDHDRAANQVRILHHQRDRFFLRLRQRPVLEHRAARADKVEEPIGIDMRLEELTRGWLLVDVDFTHVHAGRIQKTSGVFAGRSGRLRVKRRFRHERRIMEIADRGMRIADGIATLR